MNFRIQNLDFYIVIPAHNEQDFIGLTLDSLAKQTHLPKRVVVVNDNSTDNTQQIVEDFTSKYNWIYLVNSNSSKEHIPGTKIVNAFYKGYNTTDRNYDIICKFDADLIFPANYLETLAVHFREKETIGMASGFCYIEKNGNWILENLTNKDHIRGGLKAYRKECFSDIGGLKASMGWDTADELLAQYHNWDIKTDKSLHVKHLKPTGKTYSKTSKYLQGEAMYKMRYGFWLALISGIKLAYKKRKFGLFSDYMSGYFKAKSKGLPFLVSKEEGQFIRKLRWKGIRKKIL